MLRRVLLSLFICGMAAGVAAQDRRAVAPRPLASAMEAMRDGRWADAAALARRDGPAAVQMIEWYRLREGLGSPAEVLAFLERNPNWPGLALLRKRSEERFAEVPSKEILQFYHNYEPQTGVGALSYVKTLMAEGRETKAEIHMVLAWISLDLTTAEHDAFIEAYGRELSPYHEERLEMALWRDLKDVQQMLSLVNDETRKRVDVRLKIKAGKRDLAGYIDELPKEQQQDAGIAYEIFNYYIRTDVADKAMDVLLRQSRLSEGLGEPERWASWRRSFARRMMRNGEAQKAYDLASVHQLSEGSAFADLEWLSGYIALRYLDEPELALDHFQRFRSAVRSPISMGRAGYWLGRAQEALGDSEAAQVAYAQGARHQSSFYGLLAAEKVPQTQDPDLAGVEEFPSWQEAEFVKSDIFEAVTLAIAMNEISLAERFVVAMAGKLSRQEVGQLGQALADLDQPHLQVMLGKAAAKRGIVVMAPYYALHPMQEVRFPVPTEMSLSIARRESEFDQWVVSGANARGLMQILPGTAREVAREIGVEYELRKLLSDWRYNATLGSAYLKGLSEQFDGNVILMSAGYNAGPSRPVRWMEERGDPRKNTEAMVDWIEHIPFRETRNYVMRVSESVPIYRARLGGEPHPKPFSQELIGATIR